MVTNKAETLGLTDAKTLECDFNSHTESPSPLRNEYYQLAPPDSIDHFQTVQPQHLLSEPNNHNQNRGCSGGTDICAFGMPEFKEESEHIIVENNLSNSLMKLAKRESHIMSDDECDPEKQSPNISGDKSDGFVHITTASPEGIQIEV